LEERLVPASLLVTDSGDNINVAGTLRYEVAHAHNGDTIKIEPTFKMTLHGGINVPKLIVLSQGVLDLNTNITIEGMWPGTTISGDLLSGVFAVAAGANVTLSNLDITAGNALEGGGIYNGGSLAVNGCVLSGNEGIFFGGAIFNVGTLKVSASSISGNDAGWGAGIFNQGGTTALSGVCVVTGNVAGYGGGVYNASGTLTITNCFVTFNTALNRYGGGIYNDGTLTVTNCDVYGNTAGNWGGGILNDTAGSATITGGLVANTYAGSDGGGLCNDGTLYLSACAINGNSTGVAGGGVYNGGYACITNCTLIANYAGDLGGGISTTHITLVIGDTLRENYTGLGLSGAICIEAGAAFIGSSTFIANGPDTVDGSYTDLGGNTGL
jgi:hypothetical protein